MLTMWDVARWRRRRRYYRGTVTAASAQPPRPARPPFADATPAEIRAALTSEDGTGFDRQWRRVMARATERLDLTEVLQVLDAWRNVAWQTAAHGEDTYRRVLASAQHRLRTGERADGAVSWDQLKAELGLPE
jgi:cell wall assembly regulator SMI1